MRRSASLPWTSASSQVRSCTMWYTSSSLGNTHSRCSAPVRLRSTWRPCSCPPCRNCSTMSSPVCRRNRYLKLRKQMWLLTPTKQRTYPRSWRSPTSPAPLRVKTPKHVMPNYWTWTVNKMVVSDSFPANSSLIQFSAVKRQDYIKL